MCKAPVHLPPQRLFIEAVLVVGMHGRDDHANYTAQWYRHLGNLLASASCPRLVGAARSYTIAPRMRSGSACPNEAPHRLRSKLPAPKGPTATVLSVSQGSYRIAR